MSELVLSEEAQFVIDYALRVAQERKSEVLDSAHLLCALLKHNQVGKGWLSSSGENEAKIIIVELEHLLTQSSQSPSDFTEPSEIYLRIMRRAEKLSQAERLNCISSQHMLTVLFEEDTALAMHFPQQQPFIPQWGKKP